METKIETGAHMARLWRRDIDNERRSPAFLMKIKHRVSHRKFRTKRAEEDIKSLGVKPGMTLVDFGCGTGVYTIAAARIVGRKGAVHAVDLHPTLLEMLERKAYEAGITNIDTIYSDVETGVEKGSADAVLLYNMIRNTKRLGDLLKEAYGIMKLEGMLLVRQTNMQEDRVKDIILKDGLFRFMGSHGNTLKFRKVKGAFHEVS
jgi:ubiquinone/menaquinone biosynthesis C-methylase UbiE